MPNLFFIFFMIFFETLYIYTLSCCPCLGCRIYRWSKISCCLFLFLRIFLGSLSACILLDYLVLLLQIFCLAGVLIFLLNFLSILPGLFRRFFGRCSLPGLFGLCVPEVWSRLWCGFVCHEIFQIFQKKGIPL